MGTIKKIVDPGGFIGAFSGQDAADAAENAAQIQAESAALGVDEQRRQFDLTQQSLQPFTQTGADALNQQRILLGLGGSEVADPNAQQRVDLQSQLDAFDQQKTKDFSGVGGAFGSLLNRGTDKVGARQLSERQSLQSQLDALGAAPQGSQLSNAQQQQQAFDAFGDSPGQKFLRDRAQKNLLRNSSAIGGLGGGNVRSALVEQGVGFAQQDFDNQFARLGQLAGQGQAATTNIGQFGQNAANSITQGISQAGNARASGLLGGAQAQQQGATNVVGAGLAAASIFSDPKLKKNKKAIGETNGFTLWSWDWNHIANMLGLSGSSSGVMADEVLNKMPKAISYSSGFMKVNYEMVGL